MLNFIAAIFDITVNADTDIEQPFILKNKATGIPVDLTGYTAAMRIDGVNSDAVINLSTSLNGGMTIDGPAGKITVRLTNEQTALLPKTSKYDMKLVDSDGNVSRPLRGTIRSIEKITP